jgi:hypothetical protein
MATLEDPDLLKVQRLNLCISCFCLQGSLGKVTIQIDTVVMQGTISGQYTLQPETNRDGTPRTLEVEFQWSNR